MGRKPIGDTAMSSTDRQRCFLARRANQLSQAAVYESALREIVEAEPHDAKSIALSALAKTSRE